MLAGHRFTRAKFIAVGEKDKLLALGLGVTNLIPRTTAAAAELSTDELRAGASALEAKVARHRPARWRSSAWAPTAPPFRRPRATLGRQPEPMAGAEVWMLPNPSGLQATYQLPDLVAAFAELRDAVA